MIMTGTCRRSGLDWGARTWLIPPSLEVSLRQRLARTWWRIIMVIQLKHKLEITWFEEVPLDAALGGDPQLNVTNLLNIVINMASHERQNC